MSFFRGTKNGRSSTERVSLLVNGGFNFYLFIAYVVVRAHGPIDDKWLPQPIDFYNANAPTDLEISVLTS